MKKTGNGNETNVVRSLQPRCQWVEEGVDLVGAQLVGHPAGVGAHVCEAHVPHNQVAGLRHTVSLSLAQLFPLVIQPGGRGLARHSSTPQEGVGALLHHQGGAPCCHLRGARQAAQVPLRPVRQLHLSHSGELLVPGTSAAFILSNGFLGGARQAQLGNGLSKAPCLLVLGELEVGSEEAILEPGN